MILHRMEKKLYKEGERIVGERDTRHLVQIAAGKAMVLHKLKKKEVAVINVSEIWGISSFLKQKFEPSNKYLIAYAGETLVYKLDIYHLNLIFEKKPSLAGQFYCYLAGVLASYISNRRDSVPTLASLPLDCSFR
eukprot:TRINITY_DN16113_c0_g1_i1.p1 TRINITY_DN16113_c0_g1~~TRINITY_DN16113_c0_g1_i1.p1  ORF type:complete len:146 (-),score=38.15 TRINITY_DN16113_c0_g1_i1:47-451(-)